MSKLSVEALAAMVQRGFSEVDERLDELNDRFVNLDKFTGAVLLSLAQIQNQVNQILTKLGETE